MRSAYFHQLDRILDELVAMTGQVERSVCRATEALVKADPDIADEVVRDDLAIDALRDRIEDQVLELMALQQPVAGDLRTLMAAIRMVGDLERIGDLSVHVAKVARLRTPAYAVPESVRPIVGRMAELAAKMVEGAGTVIAERDVDAALRLEQDDEEMDELRRRSFHLMLGGSWAYGVEPAIDLALLGRYYERIADHAVSLARRVVYLVTGESPATAV